MKKRTDTSSKDTILVRYTEDALVYIIKILKDAHKRNVDLQQQLDDANETIRRLLGERGDGTE